MTDKLRDALESIAAWRTVNISGEYEHGLRDIIRSVTDCAAAALETMPDPAQSSPDGWKLVPITPTRKMIDRGYAARPIEECWRVMLEAAPNAEPANRSTAKATANVGDDGERMGSEPVKGIVTGGSDPTPSPLPSTMLETPEPDSYRRIYDKVQRSKGG